MAGNLKLEVTNYSRSLYGPRGAAHSSSGDDDVMTVVMRRIRRRLLAIDKGRGGTIDYLQSRHIGIQHTSFSFFFFPFFAFLLLLLLLFNFLWQTFEFSLRQRVLFKNIFFTLMLLIRTST